VHLTLYSPLGAGTAAMGGKRSFGGAAWTILDDRAEILLDYNFCAGEQRRRHVETERVSSLEID
jgi:hypothetical protein